MNRRTHLKYLMAAGTVTASTSFVRSYSAEAAWKPGVQLFPVREALKKDPRGTLEALAKIGFSEIEPFGIGGGSSFASDPFFGLTLSGFKSALKSLGFTVPTVHASIGTVDLIPKAAETALELGAHTLIHPMAAEFQSRTPEGLLKIAPAMQDDAQVKRLAELFNRMGEACKRSGIGFAYHNHHTEFSTLGGKNAYDLLLAQTDPALVKMELDIGWAKVAGVDGAQYLDRYPERFIGCHLKDFNPKYPAVFSAASPIPEQTQMVPPGEGTIDFHRVIGAMRRAGVKYGFIEIDIPKGDPIDECRRGFRYLTSLKEAAAT